MRKAALVVDDSSSLRQVVRMTLEGADFDVIEAVDGNDALDKIRGRSVHLVLSDLHMPRLDGLELTRMIRAMPDHRRTPVLMLTTDSQPERKQAGKAAGVTAWLSKPFQPSRLLMAVQTLCPR